MKYLTYFSFHSWAKNKWKVQSHLNHLRLIHLARILLLQYFITSVLWCFYILDARLCGLKRFLQLWSECLLDQAVKGQRSLFWASSNFFQYSCNLNYMCWTFVTSPDCGYPQTDQSKIFMQPILKWHSL